MGHMRSTSYVYMPSQPKQGKPVAVLKRHFLTTFSTIKDKAMYRVK
jgi:hypothetical protein